GMNNRDNQNITIKSIQQYLESNHNVLKLKLEDIKQWEITDDYFSSKGNIRHVYLRQTFDGIALLNGVANVTMNERDSVLYIASNFVYDLQDKFNPTVVKSIDFKQAVDLAAQHL